VVYAANDTNLVSEIMKPRQLIDSNEHNLDIDALIASAQEASGFLKALAHEARLLILCLLMEEEKSVTAIEEILSLRQPAISQQLARLRADGLVETRREGKNIFYSLARPEIREVIGALHRAFCQPPRSRSRATYRRPVARAAARAKGAGRRVHSLAKRSR
jgi:DNA-binding transcriptional ArsR family regulator